MLGVNPSSKLLSTDGISEYLQLIGLDWRMHFTYYFLTRQLSTYSVTPHKQELFCFPIQHKMPRYSYGPESEPESEHIDPDIITLPDDLYQFIPTRAAKRRWRRQACERRRLEHELTMSEAEAEPSSGVSPSQTPRARTPTQSASSRLQSDNRPAVNGSLLAAIEQVWELEQTADTDNDRPPFSAPSDPSNLSQVAEHASLLLDIFSRVKPVDDRQLTAVQKRLITTALASVLTITQQLRILEVSANEPLNALLDAHDDALNVYSGCVVCYARVADMLMMPCRHLTLCEVCAGSFLVTRC